MPAAGTVIGGQSTAASVTDTNVEIIGATTRLLRIQRVRVSQYTHKTSEQYLLQGQKMTTTGTGTAYTPQPKEPNNAPAFTAKVADSVEPTYTASTIFLQAAVNSLTGRDIYSPPGTETIIAPSASAGFGLAVVTPAGTTTATYTIETDVEEIG